MFLKELLLIFAAIAIVFLLSALIPVFLTCLFVVYVTRLLANNDDVLNGIASDLFRRFLVFSSSYRWPTWKCRSRLAVSGKSG